MICPFLFSHDLYQLNNQKQHFFPTFFGYWIDFLYLCIVQNEWCVRTHKNWRISKYGGIFENRSLKWLFLKKYIIYIIESEWIMVDIENLKFNFGYVIARKQGTVEELEK